jgi:hypothetical protein
VKIPAFSKERFDSVRTVNRCRRTSGENWRIKIHFAQLKHSLGSGGLAIPMRRITYVSLTKPSDFSQASKSQKALANTMQKGKRSDQSWEGGACGPSSPKRQQQKNNNNK